MKHAAMVIIMVVAFGAGFQGPASAQNSIGGVKKQAALGGPVKQASPVVPVNRTGSVVPVNKPAPVVAVNKPAPAVASAAAPLSAHAKCAGPCVAKGSR